MNPFTCPTFSQDEELITLSHGSGGKLTSQLIEEIFLPSFYNSSLASLHDGAQVSLEAKEIVVTTDSFVIQPLFFPGGDIGSLSITGTINDLAMCGAKPCFFTVAMIIEEGFLKSDLKKIVLSMQNIAKKHQIQIIAGDTKVIERKSGNNLFINTTGIGQLHSPQTVHPSNIEPGDTILLSGDIGRHGMAVMAEREGFSFTEPLLSDCGSLYPPVKAMLDAGIHIHCMRDLTRGGLATALVELSESCQKDFIIQMDTIKVHPSVQSACDLLGIDPFYVANEGRFIIILPCSEVKKALSILQAFDIAEGSHILGTVKTPSSFPCVVAINAYGIQRPLFKLSFEQLPRIC